MTAKDLEKSFSELCVISEDDKSFRGALRWNIPKGEIKKKVEGVGKYVQSNTFSIGSPSYCSFYFLFYPNGKNCDSQNLLSISIVFNRKLPDSAWVKCKIHLGIDVHKTISVSAKEFDKKIEFNDLCNNSSLRQHIYKTDLDIIMHCSVKIRIREIKCAFDKEKTCYAESRNYDLNKETFKHDSFSDVSISIDDHLIMTHKALLAQIPYFQELFDTNESEQFFELTNMEFDIFNYILTFLYSGDIPELNFKLACQLYIVASDLKIFDLKSLCSSYLGANLTEASVVVVLKLSHEYKDIALKKECYKFIKNSNVETLTEKSIII